VTATVADRVIAPFGARVVPILERAEHGAYVVLTCADGDGPEPAPGQFYMLMAATRWGGGAGERPYLPRAFSVLRAADGTLQFLLEAVGPGTSRLCELVSGDGLSIVGPLGRGFAAPRDGRRPVLCGGGVGIAPLALWQDALGPATPALLGFRDAAHAAGAGLLHDARVATDDGSQGHHGLVTELLSAELDAGPDAEVFACGPPPMLEAVRALCAQRDVPSQLALESGMACGYGACFGCVIPTTRGLIRLCLEGPVLEGSELGPEAFATPGHGS
jgi:dihydroorotate dehydrogenase electron transfer subunit